MRVRETKTLIDLRGDPQLGALPQPYAGIERRIERFAAEPAAGEAGGARIRRSDRRVALPHERGLTVKVHEVHRRRGQPGRAAVCVRPAAAEAIVQPCAHLLEGKIGCELQPCLRERHAAVAVFREQVLDVRRPVRRECVFDAGPRHPAQSPQERGIGRVVGQLRQRQLVVGPGEAAGRIDEPVGGSVTDATAQGAGMQHILAIARQADLRRGEDRRPADGDVVAWKARKRGIELGAEHDAVRQHVVVADLQSPEVASRPGEDIGGLEQVERAGEIRWRTPVRMSPGIAEMTAHVEAGPIVGLDHGGPPRRFHRHRHFCCHGRSSSQERRGPCHTSQLRDGPAADGSEM